MVKTLLFLRNTSIILFYPLFTAFCCLLNIFFGLFLSIKNQDKAIFFWAMGSLKWFGIKLKVDGQELPSDMGSCIYLFNHRSLVDIPILFGVLKYRSRFGAKKELFKIPIFGQCLRAIGTLVIDRDNRKKSIEAYQQAEKILSKNMRFILAPEGGRKLDSQLQPFKSGPFIFAISNGLPLVPVIIQGAHKVLPKGHLFPNYKQLTRVVEVHILDPISSKGFSFESRHELKEKVFKEMEKKYFTLS